MPARDRVDAFIAMVGAGQYVEAIEAFYHPHATMQENLGARREGRDALVEAERQALARSDITLATAAEPPLIEGDTVVIRWVFDIRPKAGGAFVLDELAWQRWEGDRIAEERFYYDPAQMRPAHA